MWNWLLNAFNAVIGGIEALLAFIVDLGASMVALVTCAGQILGLLVQILWQLGNISVSLAGGVLATIQSVNSPSYSWGAAQTGASQLSTAIGLEPIGWALAGIVWLIIGVSVMRSIANH